MACQASVHLGPDALSGSIRSGGSPSMEPPGSQSSTTPPAQPSPPHLTSPSSSPDSVTSAPPQQSDSRPPTPPPPPPPSLPFIDPTSLSFPDSKYHQSTCKQLSPPRDLGDWQRWSDHGIWPGGKNSGADVDIVIPCALVQILCIRANTSTTVSQHPYGVAGPLYCIKQTSCVHKIGLWAKKKMQICSGEGSDKHPEHPGTVLESHCNMMFYATGCAA